MEQAIQFTVGITCLVVGVSALLHRADWLAWLEQMRNKGRVESLKMGMLALGISALIFGFHQVWSGIALVVTLIGIIGMIEGVVYLLAPRALPAMLSVFLPNPRFFTLWSVFAIGLGVVILYGWQLTAIG